MIGVLCGISYKVRGVMNRFAKIAMNVYYPICVALFTVGVIIQRLERPVDLDSAKILWVPGTYCVYAKVSNSRLGELRQYSQNRDCESTRASINDFYENKVDILVNEIEVILPKTLGRELCASYVHCSIEKKSKNSYADYFIGWGAGLFVIRFVYNWASRIFGKK